MRYRRVVVSGHGGPDVLRVAEEDLPGPAAGEARVKVQAAGVSAFDLSCRRSGRLPSVPRCPGVGRFAEAHQLRPKVADGVPLTQAAEAHRLLEQGGIGGNIMLVTDG
jgi:NADPH:quinone reductase-like Zn-dependent oxidoreductase